VCDKCLLEVNQALSNNGRFQELFHLDAPTRKELTKAARDHEHTLADIIWKISHERAHRRNREFALRALEAQRFGVKRESQEAAAAEAERERQMRIAAALSGKNRIVAGALTTDKKWLQVDQRSENQRLQKRQAYTELQQRLDYALPDQIFGNPRSGNPTHHPANCAPKERKHNRTWELAAINATGQTMSAAGASQIFGTYVPPVVNHDGELAALKEAADSKHASYLAEQSRLEAVARAARAHEIHMYNVHVREYFEQKELFNDWEKVESDKMEKLRMEMRQKDRDEKTEIRFQKYLTAERMHLQFEDVRAYKLRDYEWQCQHELNERKAMCNEEMDQTEVDRFWGFDRFVQLQNDEEMRLRHMYEEKVAYLNNIMVKTHAIKPFVAPSFKKIGTLPEDLMHEDNEMRRREAVLRKLKAEEVRGQLKLHPFRGYIPPGI
jgi:hypothetical protein